MDTDSAYMALSGPLETLVIPDLKREYYENFGEWFPAPYCSLHHQDFVECKLHARQWEPDACCVKQTKFDKRTPGLFKEEFKGHGIIALNSKTYFCWGDQTEKHSSKGISKRENKLTKEQYMSVLQSRIPVSGTNRGFIYKNHEMLTYSQLRTGLTYFYAKRKVCNDGISTTPIEL